ncbi:WD domain, G-beta repeat [Gemmata obscuriglobus]|uniref:WD40 repeat domain-containing protein n=1 Tax=Gemmata obscuriglobus TaxID=114 RepID=A0A2Z3HB29_9BACT|nr:WD40 repeat domain-containing protein [Gemmata obscuriglobus]AWM41582.1 WD40 repeat domain-containing protein [Gemmata obscuriglobus]QEG32503.1 WD domain, G-beta repeat [Gemmata obscuriglobus]VTS11859.1 wd-40 repeat protein : WD-40 repeat protein OS=Nostoc punctiforme (strain ATCC 29133 / PCC 73102) GN=Npun_F1222 PE=4 SV=1: WD40: WD40: WD40 [Gemmata obscuriglobus UQM 2246]
MSRIACVLLLVFCSAPAHGSERLPGAPVRLGDDRFRAGGSVSHLALAPDGKRYATAHTAAPDRIVVTVWDADTGRRVHEHLVSAKLFKGLVWGTRGAFAVTGRAEPGTSGQPGAEFPDDFCVWDITDPTGAPPFVELPQFVERVSGAIDGSGPPPRAAYTDFRLSTDGSRLAARWVSADEKHAVRVFDLKPAGTAAKLTRVANIDLGAEGADGFSFSADGRTLLTVRKLNDPERGAREAVVTAWPVDSGKPKRPVRVPDGARLMYAPDARSLAVFTAGDREWGFDVIPIVEPYKSPPRTRQRLRWPLPHPETEAHDGGGFAFFPSGDILAVATGRGTLVLDTSRGKELARLEGHADTCGAVAVSADGTRIATADGFGLVRLWDAKTFRSLHEAPGHRAPVTHAELSPDGKRLLTWAEDETVRFWDLATGQELRAFAGAPGLGGTRSRDSRPTFAPDGTAILFSTKDRLVGRDLQTGLEIPLPGDLANSKPRNVVFAPDGRSVLTWADADPSVAVYDWPGGKKRFDVSPDGPVRPAHFSPDGAAVFADVRRARRWDARTGKELAPARPDDRSDASYPLVALRPNPLWLVQDLRDETPCVVASGTHTPVPYIRLGRARGDTPTFAESRVAVSPTGGLLAVESDGPARAVLLEAATQTVRRELRGHRGAVRVLGFTPDGTKLLTAGGDHTVLVWDVRLQSVPLPDVVKRETNAAKLWEALATGPAGDAYLAMSRLSREPDAAVKMARLRLKPAVTNRTEAEASRVADARAVELLAALGTSPARELLEELAGGAATAFRTQEARRALERNTR